MRYALNLSEENRILSACMVLPRGDYEGMPIVEELPEGNIYEYLYKDGKYIYDPLQEPENPEVPASNDVTVADMAIAITEGVNEV